MQKVNIIIIIIKKIFKKYYTSINRRSSLDIRHTDPKNLFHNILSSPYQIVASNVRVFSETSIIPSCEFGHIRHGDWDLPTNESAKPCIGYFHIQRQLRNPDAELDEPGMSAVLDNDRRWWGSTRLGAIEEDKPTRFRHLQHTQSNGVHLSPETVVIVCVLYACITSALWMISCWNCSRYNTRFAHGCI